MKIHTQTGNVPLDDLNLIREEEKVSDTPISDRVYTTACEVLQWVSMNPSRMAIATAGQGDIVIEWLCTKGQNLRVVIQPDRDPYIYHRGLGGPSEVVPLSCGSLVSLLAKLAQ